MSVSRHLRRLAASVVIGAILLSGSSFADIKAFNGAMVARDYKKAAAEAAATWPTLDQTRDDIAVIAREFGFAAYLAGDFATARMYGEAAVAGSDRLNEEQVYRLNSALLLRLAEHMTAPTVQSRDALAAAIVQRLADPSLDLVTFAAVDRLTAYDLDQGSWRSAAASASIGERITKGAGAEFTEMHYRFALMSASANYMANQNPEAYLRLPALSRRLIEAIAGASTEEEARPLISLYYETDAWDSTASSHLGNYKRVDTSTIVADWKAWRETAIYKAAMQRIEKPKSANACELSLTSQSKLPEVPRDKRFRDMIGTVILRMDINENGRSANPEVLAVVPNKDFADAIMKDMPRLSFKRSAKAEDGCSIAQTGYVFTMIYQIIG